jgi:NAD(P)H dehydrogenase (quinone)
MWYTIAMKTLIITAHPSTQGKTHLIANAYKKNAEGKGAVVEILNLYTTEYQLPFYSFENLRETPPHPSVKPLQDKITAADEIVFVHPIWWGNMPAISKNFIDHVFSSRFAFRYDQHGHSHGLLVGKTARVFLTSGAPRPLAYFAYELPFSPLKFIWNIFIFKTCGLKVKSFMVLPGCNAKGFCADHLTAFLKKVEKVT